jgi:hypothetical protein
MRELCGRIRKIVEAAAGPATRVLCLDISPVRTFHFAKLPDRSAAADVAAKLASQQPIDVEIVAEARDESGDLTTAAVKGSLDGFAVAAGAEEKVFWEHRGQVKPKKARAPGVAVAASAAATPSGSILPIPVALPPSSSSSSIPTVTVTAATVEHDEDEEDALSQAPKKPLPAKAPRVTPTEGQTKRQATAVGTAGKPPLVVVASKKQKLDPSAAATAKKKI